MNSGVFKRGNPEAHWNALDEGVEEKICERKQIKKGTQFGSEWAENLCETAGASIILVNHNFPVDSCNWSGAMCRVEGLQTSTNLSSVTSSSSNKNRRISQLVALCKNGTLRSYFDFQAERSFQEVNQTTSNFRKYHHFAASAEFNFLKEEIPDLIKQTEI